MDQKWEISMLYGWNKHVAETSCIGNENPHREGRDLSSDSNAVGPRLSINMWLSRFSMFWHIRPLWRTSGDVNGGER